MIRAAVIGAAGYTGAELIRWLLGHPGFEVVAISSDTDGGKQLSALYPALLKKSQLTFVKHSEALACDGTDVAFLATPHTVALTMAPALLGRGIAVIDLSADFRLKNAKEYEQWYQAAHMAPDLLEHAVYGLPEINRGILRAKADVWHGGQKADVWHDGQKTAALDAASGEDGKAVLPPLVANPGCYPTATVLAAAPALSAGLHDSNTPIIINAISGVSGAGRKASAVTHFCSVSDDLVAYGVTTHRHTPEIAQVFSDVAGYATKVIFTPHLAPLKRGMISTVVVPLKNGVDKAAIERAYTDAYADEPFVALLPSGLMPHSASVIGTNNAQLGIAYNAATHSLITSCAIDNLGKGAASQAVQNANILFGFKETEGLDGVPSLL